MSPHPAPPDAAPEACVLVSPAMMHEALTHPETLVIDVREPDEYQHVCIAGSRNIPFQDLPRLAQELRGTAHLYLVCQAGVRAREAAALLHQAGCRDVRVLEGGLRAWTRQGLPTQRLGGGLPVMRQVQLVAGSLVLIGALVPGWWWLAALIGAGLLVAGASGHCGMAMLLSRMSWNRPVQVSGSVHTSASPAKR